MRAPFISAGLCAVVLATAVAGTARGQPEAHGLTLEATLRQTLAQNPDTRVQQRQVEVNRGLVLQAQGAFDPVLSASATRDREYRPLRIDEQSALDAAGITTVHEQLTDMTSYRVGVDRTLKSGIALGSVFSVSSAADRLLWLQSVPRQTVGRLAFTLRVPLLRNAGRDVAGAVLDAAEARLAAAQAELLSANAKAILSAALAYWNYAAKARRVDIIRTSEARVTALVEETRKLIAADQIPAAELNLVLANLAEKRSARIATEQSYVESRLALARVLGLESAQAGRLARPVDDFPGVSPAARRVSDRLEALRRFALAMRADIEAARYTEQAARYGVAAARQNLKPQLDLDFSLAYSGLVQGSGPGNFNSAFNSAQTGPSALATIGLQWPWENAAARGVFTAQSAFFDTSSIRLRDLEAEVGSNVPVLAEALRRSAEQLEQGAESVRRYAVTLDNEQTKRRLGTATLIDVINVEDRLSNALLAYVQLRQGYANAIARLRYEIGAIVRREGEGYVVRLEDFMDARFDEEQR
ncbi:MAG: hypothetical protein A3G25_04290 [Betaproteobacteria bacterium RIFCSPLOWO2_12_FULL_63_13]|nr:MAG: hypothetical protein A3G25_04290 [Betaproteobacteria bacterium RIFCSPLOWO2_12_FULL_63_13]